jgi:hypothetical protein
MRRSFDRCHGLRLRGFLDPDLLDYVRRGLQHATFYDRDHDDIAREECMHENTTLAMLWLIANDPRLFGAIERITGCDTIRYFNGRVYRMRAGANHYDRWHSDMTDGRLIGISVNLSNGEFRGGQFELRSTETDAAAWQVANTGPGDAILFRIDENLRHRVTTVEGSVPRVAYAGWFQSAPDLLALLKDRASGGANED